MSIDFEKDEKAEIDVEETSVQRLAVLATKQLALLEQIDKTEKYLENLKKGAKEVSEKQIPDLMTQIGMSKFTLTNGAQVQVKPYYSGKIDDENREEAFAWLKENNNDSIIKKCLVLDFGKADGLDWESIIEGLMQYAVENIYTRDEEGEIERVPIDISLEQGIHHATLNAFIKEQVEAGNPIPLEVFKAYIGSKTKISFT
jgi:hypothetical protein